MFFNRLHEAAGAGAWQHLALSTAAPHSLPFPCALPSTAHYPLLQLNWRLSDEPIKPTEDDEWHDPAIRAATRATIYLGITSNMISCGMREVIRYLCQHKLVDVIVTTAGGVEEDMMKCFKPGDASATKTPSAPAASHYMGSFELKGEELRMRGINRIGNLLVPNMAYVAFEEWVMPVINRMHDEQEAKGTIWTPSAIIQRFGEEINDESSVWYWAAKNGIKVFCPGLTDGSFGDMLYFHLWKRGGFIVDIARDVRTLNDLTVKAKKSGMIILGGGIIKHHICNANLMRNGADYAVFINTASDYDGSDTGARPDEAISWGKIRIGANPVKIYSDATLVFPLIVSQTFAKYVQRGKQPLKAAAAAASAGGAGDAAAAAAAPAAEGAAAVKPRETLAAHQVEFPPVKLW